MTLQEVQEQLDHWEEQLSHLEAYSNAYMLAVKKVYYYRGIKDALLGLER